MNTEDKLDLITQQRDILKLLHTQAQQVVLLLRALIGIALILFAHLLVHLLNLFF